MNVMQLEVREKILNSRIENLEIMSKMTSCINSTEQLYVLERGLLFLILNRQNII